MTQRIGFKRILAVLAALVLAVCTLSSCGEKDGVTITVFNWSGYIDDEVCADFKERTGITVKYDTFDTNEAMYTSVKADPAAYDVLLPSEYMIQRMMKEGMLTKIDKNNVPNLSNIDAYFNGRISDLDVGSDKMTDYMVPYMWGTVGVLYNSDVVDANDVKSWSVLWNEKYKKRIFMLDSVRDSIGVTLKYLGYSLNTTNETEIAEAKELLLDQKPLALSYEGETVKDKIIGGEGDIAVVYSGDTLPVKDEVPSVEYYVPDEGSNVWFDGMVIPKQAKHKAEAEAFINYLTDPEIAAQQSQKTGYSSANAKALDFLPADLRESYIYNPDKSILDRCEMFMDLGEFKNVYEKTWNDILTGE